MSMSSSASRVLDRQKDFYKPGSKEVDKGMPSSSKSKSKSSSNVSEEAGKTVRP